MLLNINKLIYRQDVTHNNYNDEIQRIFEDSKLTVISEGCLSSLRIARCNSSQEYADEETLDDIHDTQIYE